MEGSRPEQCISNMISRVSCQNGVFRLYIIVEIHHSGRKPSIYSRDTHHTGREPLNCHLRFYTTFNDLDIGKCRKCSHFIFQCDNVRDCHEGLFVGWLLNVPATG